MGLPQINKKMPYKNKTKQLIEGGYYHAYNRGYNRNLVFHDDRDYKTFLYIVKKYLDPNFTETKILPTGESVKVSVGTPLYEKVELQAFCLMPNHFHFLVKQFTEDGMPRLLNILCSQYTSYYNSRYKRSGTIWQGTYKAVRLTSEEQYLHVSRYIHLNPVEVSLKPKKLIISNLSNYPYSSYGVFINKKKYDWLNSRDILQSFLLNQSSSQNSYQSFVESYYLESVKDRHTVFEIMSDLYLDY